MKRGSLKIHDLNLTYDQFIQKEKKLIGLKIGDKYEILQKLGEGSFGSVWKGANIVTRQKIAIKVLDLQAVQKQPSAYKKGILQRLIKSQAEMMSICQSPNVIKCFQVYQNKSLKMMVIEYCADKDLQTEVEKSKYLSEQDAVLILKQILNGLAEMHRNGIIHRDLKAQNILIHKGVYKIADFGFSKQLGSNSTYNQLMHTKLGTIYTMAPEVLKGSKYGLQADIWSIGIIFYFMLYGSTPYEQNTYQRVLKQIEKKKIFEVKHKNSKFKLSQEAKSFIQKCLTVDSQKRLNWKNIANHKLFSKYENDEQIKSSIRMSVSLNKNFMQELNQRQIIVRNDQQQSKQQRKEKSRQLKKNSEISLQRKQDEKASACSTDSPCQWSKETSFQCQITNFILTQVAEKIQKIETSLTQKRQIIEIVYLLYARCFLNMSFRLQHLTDFEQKSISQSLTRQINKLYTKSSQKFKEYSQKLTKKQSQFMEVIQDKLASLMLCTTVNEKDIYFTGIQLPNNRINVLFDYTKSEQINFTQKMITESKKIILQSKLLNQKILKYLLNYENICLLTFQQAGKAYNLKTYIQSHFCCS